MLKELSEKFNRDRKHKKDIETIKNKQPENEKNKKQPEINNTISKMRTTLEEINNRLNEAEDWISNLEDKAAENTQFF